MPCSWRFLPGCATGHRTGRTRVSGIVSWHAPFTIVASSRSLATVGPGRHGSVTTASTISSTVGTRPTRRLGQPRSRIRRPRSGHRRPSPHCGDQRRLFRAAATKLARVGPTDAMINALASAEGNRIEIDPAEHDRYRQLIGVAKRFKKIPDGMQVTVDHDYRTRSAWVALEPLPEWMTRRLDAIPVPAVRATVTRPTSWFRSVDVTTWTSVASRGRVASA